MANIFDGIQSEGIDPFAEQEQEEIPTSADSSTEETESTEETGADQDNETENANLPLHKDARFKRVIEERNQLRDKLSEIEAWREEIEAERSAKKEQEESVTIPDWYVTAHGYDEEGYKSYLKSESEKEETLLEKLQTKQQAEAEKEESEKTYWANWVTEKIESIEETHGKMSQDTRNKLNKVMEDYTPTDSEGNLDFEKGYALMEKVYAKTSNERKSLVDTSNSSKTVDTNGYQGQIRIY